jgi:signal transduction histidine kinase
MALKPGWLRRWLAVGGAVLLPHAGDALWFPVRWDVYWAQSLTPPSDFARWSPAIQQAVLYCAAWSDPGPWLEPAHVELWRPMAAGGDARIAVAALQLTFMQDGAAAALVIQQRLLARLEAAGDLLWQGICLLQGGDIQWRTGDLAAARRSMVQAHRVFGLAAAHDWKVVARMRIGRLHHMLGDFGHAAVVAQDVLELIQQTPYWQADSAERRLAEASARLLLASSLMGVHDPAGDRLLNAMQSAVLVAANPLHYVDYLLAEWLMDVRAGDMSAATEVIRQLEHVTGSRSTHVLQPRIAWLRLLQATLGGETGVRTDALLETVHAGFEAVGWPLMRSLVTLNLVAALVATDQLAAAEQVMATARPPGAGGHPLWRLRWSQVHMELALARGNFAAYMAATDAYLDASFDCHVQVLSADRELWLPRHLKVAASWQSTLRQVAGRFENLTSLMIVTLVMVSLLCAVRLWWWRSAIANERRARLAAEETSALKTEFLANMSHEIRNPLNGLIGMASVLAAMPMTHRQRTCIDSITACAQQLKDLLESILDLSRLEGGRLPIDEQPFQPRASVEACHRMLAADFAAKGLTIQCDVAAAVPDVVVGDALRVRQILFNLLHNAVKFTETGGVRLTMEWVGDGAARGLLITRVCDSGCGIPANLTERVFEPFFQVDTRSTRLNSGVGLGLTLSQRLARLMGGSLVITATGPAGSCFELRLPLATVADASG